jgi:hypothetical protein
MLSISRRKKVTKKEILNIRVTTEQLVKLKTLQKDLQFKSMSDMIIFNSEILNSLKQWQDEGKKFYYGDPIQKEYKEVIFELTPEK